MKNSKYAIFLLTTIVILTIQIACGKSVSTPTSAPSFQEGTIPLGDSQHELTVGDLKRAYMVHVPNGYQADIAFPVVFIFHGYGLNSDEMERITHFSDQAEKSNFIAIYPEGSGETASWNGGRCCGEAAVNEVDDIEFIRSILADLGTYLNIDAKRVYATGFSNGAIMVYRLACDLADQIVAIAPVGAASETIECQPSRAVPVIHFHGTADELNPYQGGRGRSGKLELSSVGESIQFWVEENQCPTSPETTRKGKIIHDRYAPCDGDSAVELYTITDGEHAWPGGEPVSESVGIPTDEIYATPLIWEFFSAFKLP